MNSRSFLPGIISVVFLLFYCALVLSGIKTFTLGSQIAVLTDKSPLYLLEVLHPHALRYLIAWPVVWVAKYTSVNVNTLYSFYVVLIAYLMSLTLGSTLKKLRADASAASGLAKDYAWYTAGFLGTWLIILLDMEGNMIFAFFGMSIILYSQVVFLSNVHSKNKTSTYHFAGLQIIGLFFSAVSSGTFSVVFCAVAMFFIAFSVIKYKKDKIILHNFVIANFVLLVFFLPFQAQFIAKNACFFSGEIANYSVCTRLMPSHPSSDVDESDSDSAAKAVSFADSIEEYAGYSTFEKAIIHSPVKNLISAGISMQAAKIIFCFIFIAGILAAIISYFYKPLILSTLSPLFASTGISISVGLFGIKAMLMMFPAILLCSSIVLISTSHNLLKKIRFAPLPPP